MVPFLTYFVPLLGPISVYFLRVVSVLGGRVAPGWLMAA